MRVYLNPTISKIFQEKGILFSKPRSGDAGYDLYAAENVVIPPGKSLPIRTGTHLQIPAGHVGIIKDRSSMAVKKNQYTHGGVIDSSYTGEIIGLLENTTHEPYTVKEGDKFCQILIVPCSVPELTFVQDLKEFDQTERGDKGFGSTGN